MKKLILLFLSSLLANAQIKGVVKDSLTGEPIQFVNIYASNNKVFNSDSKGNFVLEENIKGKAIFQLFGYQSKSCELSDNMEIKLIPIENQIKEVIIKREKQKIEKEIDIFESYGFRYHNNNHGCAILLKRDSLNKNCNFLKKIKFHTDSNIDKAKLKISFLNNSKFHSIEQNEIVHDTIIEVKKGARSNLLDLSNTNIQIPDEGLFICFENLLIEENKYFFETTGRMPNGEKKTFKSMSYEPEISLVPSNQFTVYYRRFSTWEKAKKVIIENPNSYEMLLMKKYHEKILTPSVKITLTN